MIRLNISITIPLASYNDDTIVKGGRGSQSYDRNYPRGK